MGGSSDGFEGFVNGFVECGVKGLGVNVGRGEALRGRGGGGADAVVFRTDFEDANVVPHLVLLLLGGNEVVSGTGMEDCASTLLTPEISSLILSSPSCSRSFCVFLCCSSSKAIHSSFSRFFSATS